MEKKLPHTNTLIALYDATPETALYGNAQLASEARAIGSVCAELELGIVARVGSPSVQSVLASAHEKGGTVVALSPAASRYEHEKAFRLPLVSLPLIFTGRGALGADVVALSSGHAALIIGSEDEALEGILGCMGVDKGPVAIFTEERPSEVRERINARYPKLVPHLLIGSDAKALMHDVCNELRKRHLNQKLA